MILLNSRSKPLTLLGFMFLGIVIMFVQHPSSHAQDTPDVLFVEWSPDGSLIALGGTDGFLKIQNNQGQVLLSLSGHQDRVLTAEWNPDGTKLASAGDDKIVRVWNINDSNYPAGELLAEFVGHQDIILSLAWHPDQDVLVSATRRETNNFRVWDVAAFSPIPILETPIADIFEAKWNSDGTKLALGTGVGVFVFDWPFDSKNVELAEHLYGEFAYATAIDWNDDVIAVGRLDGSVYFLDTTTNQITGQFPAHSDRVVDIEYSPDGSEVITVGLDDTLKRWHIETGRRLQSLSVFGYQVSWHPDGQLTTIGRRP